MMTAQKGQRTSVTRRELFGEMLAAGGVLTLGGCVPHWATPRDASSLDTAARDDERTSHAMLVVGTPTLPKDFSSSDRISHFYQTVDHLQQVAREIGINCEPLVEKNADWATLRNVIRQYAVHRQCLFVPMIGHGLERNPDTQVLGSVLGLADDWHPVSKILDLVDETAALCKIVCIEACELARFENDRLPPLRTTTYSFATRPSISTPGSPEGHLSDYWRDFTICLWNHALCTNRTDWPDRFVKAIDHASKWSKQAVDAPSQNYNRYSPKRMARSIPPVPPINASPKQIDWRKRGDGLVAAVPKSLELLKLKYGVLLEVGKRYIAGTTYSIDPQPREDTTLVHVHEFNNELFKDNLPNGRLREKIRLWLVGHREEQDVRWGRKVWASEDIDSEQMDWLVKIGCGEVLVRDIHELA